MFDSSRENSKNIVRTVWDVEYVDYSSHVW